MTKKKIFKIILYILVALVVIITSLALIGTVAHATGLVDDTINVSNEYSKYSLSNYQLDFYVDNSWGWLPWNWGDGIGKQVMYGLYAITNFIWTVSLFLSNATGYLIQEAYNLDFISDTANAIGSNIQTIAGINKNGFMSEGFYVGFLLILILVLGIYVTYTGVLKRETTKATKAVINFITIFIVSASFIAFAPDYITKINDFSKDVSNASLTVGTNIIMPETDSAGKDSVDIIRDSLFSIQVKQPWLLLQFDNSDINEIGQERVEKLLSIIPDTNNGKDREQAVINEIEKQNNSNLTITNTMSRLGMVFFLFIFNIIISIFVFLLTGIMIFSQVLFIIYAMFLPISFLLSMIPTFNGITKKAITKLFNVVMARAGITLIITVAFSISTMLYKLSTTSPFFLVAFLQIVTFAGIYFKLGDLMGMFSLKSHDSHGMAKQITRRPKMFFIRQSRSIQNRLNRSFSKLGKSSDKPTKQSDSAPPTSNKNSNNQRDNTKSTVDKQSYTHAKSNNKLTNNNEQQNSHSTNKKLKLKNVQHQNNNNSNQSTIKNSKSNKSTQPRTNVNKRQNSIHNTKRPTISKKRSIEKNRDKLNEA